MNQIIDIIYLDCEMTFSEIQHTFAALFDIEPGLVVVEESDKVWQSVQRETVIVIEVGHFNEEFLTGLDITVQSEEIRSDFTLQHIEQLCIRLNCRALIDEGELEFLAVVSAEGKHGKVRIVDTPDGNRFQIVEYL
jgi:hypothetical protein